LLPPCLAGAGSLAVCFRGYGGAPIFLLVVVIAAGAVVGSYLFRWSREGWPSGVDLLIVCGACAVLTVAARAFHLAVYALVLGLRVTLPVARVRGWPITIRAWVAGRLVGSAAALEPAVVGAAVQLRLYRRVPADSAELSEVASKANRPRRKAVTSGN